MNPIVALSILFFIKSIKTLHASEETNYEELAGLFEGDIELEDVDGLQFRSVHPLKKWPNRTLVYYMSPGQFNSTAVELIKKAMSEISSKTCIKFRERCEDDRNFVNITNNNTGCHSWIGRIQKPAPQQLNLYAPKDKIGCLVHGTIMHEFMHALGFYHEQSRPDRDEYITVVEENVIEGKNAQFKKYQPIDTLDTPYDLCSVMHYRTTAFSKVKTFQFV